MFLQNLKLFHQIGNVRKKCKVASTLNCLLHSSLELQRSAGDATRKDFSLFVQELLEEFRVLVVDVLDSASLKTAVFLFLHVH